MKTILIVDDRADNRAVLVAMLAHRNYRLIEASNAEDALALVRKEKPDLVITDVLMPRMDGYQFVARLWADPTNALIKVIFYTASYIEEESRSLAEACGVGHVIIKPAEPEAVFAAVDAALGTEARPAPLPAPEFARDHLNLVSNKLVEKVEELEQLTAKLEEEIIQRRNAQENLERLRRHHELILNSAGEGIHGLNLEGNIIFENPQGAALLGWPVNDLLGRAAHATMHHSHANGKTYPIEECPIFACMRDGKTRRITNDVFWRKDGTSFRVDYVVAPTRDEKRLITGSIVTFKDITEQVEADTRLKLQGEQYRLLFQTNPNSMWVFNTETLQILAANEAATVQYGYTPGEFLHLTLKDLRPSEDTTRMLEALSGPQTPAHFAGEFRHKRKDGSLIIVEIYSGALIWEGISARIVTAIDVTERKRAQAHIREQADIIDRAHDAIIVREFESDRITIWNSGAERVYGWRPTEAIGRPMRELIFAEPNDHDVRLRLIAAGEYHGEIKHRAKDGREVIVDARVTLIRNDDGAPRSVLGINTDITERKKLETQLLRSQRLESIGTLASGVAHDLNNILTPIMTAAGILREQLDDEDLLDALSLIEESAKRGASVIKQVLTFARGAEGQRVTIDPRHLLEEMADIARKTFPKSIEIATRYPEDLWRITGDPTQLHQVLLNLSVNARDAMVHGGSLRFTAENVEIDQGYAEMLPEASVGPHLLLQVSDTGTGMSRATIDKIFDPFFTTKEVGKGTGLGLSTSLGIVRNHGGFLLVESDPGRGANFKIFLPAICAPAPAGEVATPQASQGNNELVLLVEDEDSVRRVTKMILEKNRYRVLEARDGPAALGVFAEQKQSIDLVLTDVNLPYMDGVELIRAITQIKPGTIFIASSGQGDNVRSSELQSLNVARLLEKPYDSHQLLQTVHGALAGVRDPRDS